MVLARGATWGQPVDNFCWCAGLTSVWAYVGPSRPTYIYTHVRDYMIYLVLSIVQTCEIFTVDKGHQMRPNEVNSNQDGATQHETQATRQQQDTSHL
jgi:hypothetical protein